MKYKNIKEGRFISRPNRFIANVEIDGKIQAVHVKNTGRCRELLIPGARVLLEKGDNPKRKTKHDLVSVYKGDRLINMDSQAPNKLAEEFFRKGGLFGKITVIRPETTYKSSRFDFYIETEREKIFVEIKGVTLENDGAVYFPDAPTQRGVKHLRELTEALREGMRCAVIFVIQMKGVRYFAPNDITHPEFGVALRAAAQAGVEVYAFDCIVAEDEVVIGDRVEIRLEEQHEISAF